MVENELNKEKGQLPEVGVKEPPNAPRKAPARPNIPAIPKPTVPGVYANVDATKDQTIVTKTTITKPRTKKAAKGVTEQVSKTTVKSGVVSHSEKKVVKKTSKDGTKTIKTVTQTVISKPTEQVVNPPLPRAKPARPMFPSPQPFGQPFKADAMQENKYEPKPEPDAAQNNKQTSQLDNMHLASDTIEAANISEVHAPSELEFNEAVAAKEPRAEIQAEGGAAIKSESSIAPEEMNKAKTELESEIISLYQATKIPENQDTTASNQEEEGLNLSKRDKILIGLMLFIIVMGAIVVLLVPGIMPMS